jgi:hypothetical protein
MSCLGEVSALSNCRKLRSATIGHSRNPSVDDDGRYSHRVFLDLLALLRALPPQLRYLKFNTALSDSNAPSCVEHLKMCPWDQWEEALDHCTELRRIELKVLVAGNRRGASVAAEPDYRAAVWDKLSPRFRKLVLFR